LTANAARHACEYGIFFVIAKIAVLAGPMEQDGVI
jgi:hypothetical protein